MASLYDPDMGDSGTITTIVETDLNKKNFEIGHSWENNIGEYQKSTVIWWEA